MWWIEFLEFVLFFICLYLAYLGCKQDFSAERRPCLSNTKRDKVVKHKSKSQCNENNSTVTEPDLPSYSEVVHS